MKGDFFCVDNYVFFLPFNTQVAPLMESTSSGVWSKTLGSGTICPNMSERGPQVTKFGIHHVFQISTQMFQISDITQGEQIY